MSLNHRLNRAENRSRAAVERRVDAWVRSLSDVDLLAYLVLTQRPALPEGELLERRIADTWKCRGFTPADVVRRVKELEHTDWRAIFR